MCSRHRRPAAGFVEAEAAQRGYIITRTRLPRARLSAEARSDSVIAVLRSLLRDNPVQQLRVDTIAELPDSVVYIDSSVAAMRSASAIGASIVARGPVVISWPTFVA
jgi:CHASE3 domain sensor protein